MNCKAFEQQLEAYLAGDLVSTEQTEMEKHQTTCVHCQRLADRATRLDGLMHNGLTAVAAISPKEQAALRESVLGWVGKTQPSLWRQWAPRLAGLAITLATLIVVGLILMGRKSVPTVSAAEIIARAQAAVDEHAGLSGVLHWETSIEQWSPTQRVHYETEIWFDFDDPGRYRLNHGWRANIVGARLSWQMVRDGIDHVWVYMEQNYWEDTPYVEEVVLSAEEMQELALWHVPSPFREDLTRFAEMLPDVELVGETTTAGRKAHLLRGHGVAFEAGSDEVPPRLVTSTVTLTVDAETFWLLGLEELVEGEARPRIVYRTEQFEILSQEQVAESAFMFTPPPDVQVRRLYGIESWYYEPHLPTITLKEAVEAAPFVFMLPTALPQDLEPLPFVLVQESLTDTPPMETYELVYQRGPGRVVRLFQSAMPEGPGLAARPIEVGDRQGWLVSDLIDSRQFTIYLPDWEIARRYDTLRKWQAALDSGVKLRPGGVSLKVWGFSAEEAIAVLESLEPYTP